MNKLLDKPLKIFAVYALLILVCSVPAYYFIVESIWINELDEHNFFIKQQAQNGFNQLNNDKQPVEKSLDLWRKMQPGFTIQSVDKGGKDSVYTVDRSTSHDDSIEKDRFRGLVSYIKIAGESYRIIIESNIEEANETVAAISMITGLFIVLLLSGFIILNRRLSKKVWQPFIDTLEKLKKFDLNNGSSIKFTETTISEFEEMNLVLTMLIENNIRIYNQQKEFLENASHELQTPLALLKSKIDILIQDDALTQKHREAIESLSESVSRVSKINKNLLLLTGIENKSYPSAELILNDTVNRLVNDFKEIYPHKQVVSKNLDRHMIVKANEGLLEVLLNNLLSNSFRHGDTKGLISVELINGKLIIKNFGQESLKSDALFKRFQTASPDNPGTGLGLAIAKEICEKYGWEISYRFSEGEHQFSVMF